MYPPCSAAAVLNEVNKAQMKGEEINVPDLAASFQDRIAGILAEKLRCV